MSAASRAAEAVVSLAPGEAVTHLVMAVAIDRMSGAPVVPRASASGTRVPLPPRLLRGGGEMLVLLRGDETLVRLEGEPPPWPWSWRWEHRTLRRLLGRRLVRFVEAGGE